MLPAETSAEPGPWRTSRVPHTRAIMRSLSPSDPCQEVTFVAGTQVGKTEIGNNFVGFVMDEAPGPMMMVLPTSNTGKRSSRTRLAKMIESTPSLRAKISDGSRSSANSATMKEFPGGVLIVAGSNSAADLKSQPIRYLFEDELDEYPDDVDGQGPADELAEKRTDTFVRKKIFRTSTPTEKGRSKIWRHWLKSDQRRYYVPCPHCAAEQLLVWDQVRWETKKVWEITLADTGEIREVEADTDGAIARDTGEVADCWYECVACEERIDEYQKTEMLERGRWIAAVPASRRHGYHLSALYSPVGWYSWRTAVEKRIEADKDPSKYLLKTWTNTVAAEPYADVGDQVRALDIKSRVDGYSLKHVPAGGLILSAGADIQADRIEVKVKAWGRDEESWLIDYQVFIGDTETAEPWERMAEYLHESRFTHEYNVPMRVLATAVDTGYRTQTAYDFCRRYRHRGVIAVKGASRPGKSVLGRPTAQDVNHRGVFIKGGVELWPLGVDTAKARIYARLKISKPGPGCIHFPLGLPDEYFDGLVSERLVTRYKNGYAVRVFEKDAGVRNEPLDVEVYAYAAALYLGVNRVNWDKLEATLRASAGDLFVAAAQPAAEPVPDAAPAVGVDAAAASRRARPPVPAPKRAGFVQRYRS